MSRYFDTLNRLRKGRDTATGADLGPAGEAVTFPAGEPEESAAGPGLPFPELQLASRQASYGALLDRLRATRKSSGFPAVVIAGASGGEPVPEVIAGIELQASRRGVSLKCGRLGLSTGARILHFSSRHPLRGSSSPTSTDHRESLRLSGSLEPGALSSWLEEAAQGCELLLIEAPAISSSVDAALLGNACDGLVVVAEAMVTKRAAVEEAVERAQLAGCEILGIVLTGTKRWLPRWLDRLLELSGTS